MILLRVTITVYGVVKVTTSEYQIFIYLCLFFFLFFFQDAKPFLNEVFKEQMNTYARQLIHVPSISIVVKVVRHVVYDDAMKLE